MGGERSNCFASGDRRQMPAQVCGIAGVGKFSPHYVNDVCSDPPGLPSLSQLPNLLIRKRPHSSGGKPSLGRNHASCGKARPSSRSGEGRMSLPRSIAATPGHGRSSLSQSPLQSPVQHPSTPQQASSIDARARRRHQLAQCLPDLNGALPARMPTDASAGSKASAPISRASPSKDKFNWQCTPWPSKITSSKIVVSVAMDANEGWRSYMEDGHKIVNPFTVEGHDCSHAFGRVLDQHWCFFAVYDGHGGHEAMSWLETNFHHLVAAELCSLKMAETGCHHRADVSEALTRAFKKADGQLATLGASNYGSTATVALMHNSPVGKMLYVANVGDSRAVLIGGPSVKHLSVDHHTSNPLEAARVERDGGCIFRRRVCGSLSVTRALGDHALKGEGGGVSCVPDISVSKVLGAKALVLASDGLWDVLNGEEVQEILEEIIIQAVQKEQHPELIGDQLRSIAARALVECAKNRGSHDNICVVVAFL